MWECAELVGVVLHSASSGGCTTWRPQRGGRSVADTYARAATRTTRSNAINPVHTHPSTTSGRRRRSGVQAALRRRVVYGPDARPSPRRPAPSGTRRHQAAPWLAQLPPCRPRQQLPHIASCRRATRGATRAARAAAAAREPPPRHVAPSFVAPRSQQRTIVRRHLHEAVAPALQRVRDGCLAPLDRAVGGRDGGRRADDEAERGLAQALQLLLQVWHAKREAVVRALFKRGRALVVRTLAAAVERELDLSRGRGGWGRRRGRRGTQQRGARVRSEAQRRGRV